MSSPAKTSAEKRIIVSPAELTIEFRYWQRKVEEKKMRLRFGQYMFNIYGVRGVSWPELFYSEEPLYCYGLILSEIT